MLSLLKLPVFALHAEMQQKQRLKKLEGFRAHQKGILVVCFMMKLVMLF